MSSVYSLKLVEVGDELGFSIVDANKAFEALGNRLGIPLYEALKAVEQLFRIKNIPFDDLICREDGTPVVPHMKTSLSHSEFLRVVLKFQRDADKYEAADEFDAVDGFKPSQRKILFAAFKKGWTAKSRSHSSVVTSLNIPPTTTEKPV